MKIKIFKKSLVRKLQVRGLRPRVVNCLSGGTSLKTRSLLIIVLTLLSYNIVAQNSIHEQQRFKYYTVEDGLSSNDINSFCNDKYGRLWVGTSNGLNVFDGYSFKVYNPGKNISNGLSAGPVRVFADSKGNIYVSGFRFLAAYDYIADEFILLFNKDSSKVIVKAMFELEEGQLWFGGQRIFVHYNTFNNEFTKIPLDSSIKTINAFCRKNNNIYIATTQGLAEYNLSNKDITVYNHDENNPLSISNNHIESVCTDKNNNLWIGTRNGVINLFNEKDTSFIKYDLRDKSLISNGIKRIYVDRQGSVWVGALNGLNKYNEEKKIFSRYAYQSHEISKLRYNKVHAIFEDIYDVLWVGSSSGGISYTNLKHKKIIHYKAKANNNTFLNNPSVYAISKDKKGNTVVGTGFGGVNIFNPKTQIFNYIMHQDGNPNSISENRIRAISVDDNNNYWIVTHNHLDYYNTSTKKIKHYSEKDGVNQSKARDVLIDSKNNVWYANVKSAFLKKKGSNKFINVCNTRVNHIIETKTGEIIGVGLSDTCLYKYDIQTNKLVSERRMTSKLGECYTIFEDSENRLWIGREKGLTLLNIKNKTSVDYTAEHGLIQNRVTSILEDNSKNLWLSGTNGLCILIMDSINTTSMFRKYHLSDGLQSMKFFHNSCYKDENGMLYFGGSNGYNAFFGDEIKNDVYKPNIIFNKLKVFNEEVKINEKINGMVLLKKSLMTSEEITLSYKHSVFTIEFAALRFLSPKKIKYAYMLEGFDKKWNIVDASARYANYTNLPHGKYTLKVKSTNLDQIWNENFVSLKINILTPWWKTWWFISIIILAFGGGVYFVIKFFVFKEKVKFEKEISEMRLKFFTNVAHEFRTPLVLIIAPFEKLISSIKLNRREIAYVNLIKKNTKVLNKLIDEFLYFRSSQNEYAKLNVSQIDVVSFLKGISAPFKFLALEHKIEFVFQSDMDNIKLWFDPDKMGKIINNLFMNAFKYTLPGGQIKLSISQDTYNFDRKGFSSYFKKSMPNNKAIKISVSDTGKGMSKEQTKNIFQRFYQVDDRKVGSGIGLNLVNTLVKLHGGKINVQSELGVGSVFDLYFMEDNKHFKNENIKNDAVEVENYVPTIDIVSLDLMKKELIDEQSENEEGIVNSENNTGKPQVLVVEDNNDLRHFLVENLEDNYHVNSANNGTEGLRIAKETLPDLILSDVRMPGLNGLNLCNKIKGEISTSHIFVILLSSNSNKEDKIKGLKAGADDYIGKPFDFQYLLLKINSLLNSRKKIEEILLENPHHESEDLLDSISEFDQEFLEKCKGLILSNLSNTEFSVQELSDSVGLSRSHMGRKLAALINQTPIEWIYSFRLVEAKKLLSQENHTVSEIADLTGFSSPNSFGTVFKKKYGISPKDFSG